MAHMIEIVTDKGEVLAVTGRKEIAEWWSFRFCRDTGLRSDGIGYRGFGARDFWPFDWQREERRGATRKSLNLRQVPALVARLEIARECAGLGSGETRDVFYHLAESVRGLAELKEFGKASVVTLLVGDLIQTELNRFSAETRDDPFIRETPVAVELRLALVGGDNPEITESNLAKEESPAEAPGAESV